MRACVRACVRVRNNHISATPLASPFSGNGCTQTHKAQTTTPAKTHMLFLEFICELCVSLLMLRHLLLIKNKITHGEPGFQKTGPGEGSELWRELVLCGQVDAPHPTPSSHTYTCTNRDKEQMTSAHFFSRAAALKSSAIRWKSVTEKRPYSPSSCTSLVSCTQKNGVGVGWGCSRRLRGREGTI